ncbi:hypothetical protein BGZ80_009411 [Entomortierella chlamydospora]|uniref:Uncharacterized protein n=1 Tax=Entomortierella chlamydospora TaxID=101097 RepID=A0A9P6T0I6_9FUNG|nr:hypothetical protein BGZ79_001513 [Entomortierella chlamydospora]KAG0016139.1 hypothetical protein BGZ80_009411 [Entomortierella chlamydospora]
MPRDFASTVHAPSKRPLMFRIKGTVILDIWWQVILVGIFSTVVYLIDRYSSWKINYSLSLVTVLGTVVSLLLVFRTNTAYDRYWEGRRLWSQMTLCIRNLTRAIWVCVPESETRDLLEKKSAINLLVAFSFATKHYLRGEYAYDYDDMVGLLTHIPKYALPTSTEPIDWRNDVPTSLDQIQPQQQGNATASNISQGRLSTSDVRPRRRRQTKKQALAFDYRTPTNIPIELSFYIGSYIRSCAIKGKPDAGTLTIMNNALVGMVDCLTGFERILRTPIPLAYSIHLHHATWLYILALPFQLLGNMKEVMIPAVMLAAFALLGILGIGYEIENPFNDDYNDLPLDDFCRVIKAEVDAMVANRAPFPADWIFSGDNHPLSNSHLTAKELSGMTLNEIHRLMEAEATLPPPTVEYARPVAGNVISHLDVPAQAPIIVVDTVSEKKQ